MLLFSHWFLTISTVKSWDLFLRAFLFQFSVLCMQKLMTHFCLHVFSFCMHIFQHLHRNTLQALKLSVCSRINCVKLRKLCFLRQLQVWEMKPPCVILGVSIPLQNTLSFQPNVRMIYRKIK